MNNNRSTAVIKEVRQRERESSIVVSQEANVREDEGVVYSVKYLSLWLLTGAATERRKRVTRVSVSVAASRVCQVSHHLFGALTRSPRFGLLCWTLWYVILFSLFTSAVTFPRPPQIFLWTCLYLSISYVKLGSYMVIYKVC